MEGRKLVMKRTILPSIVEHADQCNMDLDSSSDSGDSMSVNMDSSPELCESDCNLEDEKEEQVQEQVTESMYGHEIVNEEVGGKEKEEEEEVEEEEEEEDLTPQNCILRMLKKRAGETGLKQIDLFWLNEDTEFDAEIKYPTREPCRFIQKVQTAWEKGLYGTLCTIFTETGTPLAQLRSPEERKVITKKWDDVARYTQDLKKYRPVYGPKDFLAELLRVRAPGTPKRKIIGKGKKKLWGFANIPLRTKTMPELEDFYEGLSRGDPMLAVGHRMLLDRNYRKKRTTVTMYKERYNQARVMLKFRDVDTAKKLVQRGCPHAMRGPLWSLILGVESDKGKVQENYLHLKQMVIDIDLVVDKLSLIDLTETANNDPQYFPYTDRIQQMMLLFSRDTEIMEVFSKCSANPTHALLGKDREDMAEVVVYPPSGVIPFYGFCMFIAPLCYIYDNPADMYHLFRAFYKRHLFHLHEVSSHPQGILSLCILFERLLVTHEPKLYAHFKLIGDNPIRPIFKWLLRAFSGHLPLPQLLNLWDLIIAYESLEIVPLLAVAILALRKKNLGRAETSKHVDNILSDLSTIKCVELLQFTLVRMAGRRKKRADEKCEHLL